MAKSGHPEPVKSSCTICPFRSDSEWAEMAEKHPDEFGEAVRFDEDSESWSPPPQEKERPTHAVPSARPEISCLFTSEQTTAITSQI